MYLFILNDKVSDVSGSMLSAVATRQVVQGQRSAQVDSSTATSSAESRQAIQLTSFLHSHEFKLLRSLLGLGVSDTL